ncbi:MAG: hypothetical protein FJ271_01870 [Planctomycetes bacterium]|nr:hypothetical protein [Planctomycetota bacterium]
MDQSPSITEAVQILGRYHRAVVTRIAEEIVENQEDFEDWSYSGKAEELIDRHGLHLQNIARVYCDLMSLASPNIAGCGLPANFPGAPVPPSGRAIGRDTILEVGSSVLAEQCGAWWRASVLALEDDGTVRIHYEGWDDSWDETVPRRRLQHTAEAPEAGDSGDGVG